MLNRLYDNEQQTRAQTTLSILVRHRPTNNRVIGVEVRQYEGWRITCDRIETQASNSKASRIDNGKNR